MTRRDLLKIIRRNREEIVLILVLVLLIVLFLIFPGENRSHHRSGAEIRSISVVEQGMSMAEMVVEPSLGTPPINSTERSI